MTDSDHLQMACWLGLQAPGCVSREQVSAGDLLALSSGSGNLYATGHDRSVNIIAPKNWKIMGVRQKTDIVWYPPPMHAWYPIHAWYPHTCLVPMHATSAFLGPLRTWFSAG